ncbi:MAG: glucose-6-phosphate dehydrogenase assembly protein OpcA [Chlamydiota bacterium]
MSQLVSPAEIETKLAYIWDSFQGTNKMRACLFNLIIYTQQGARTTYFSTIAQKVIEKFPSRILFITYNDKATDRELKTAVSVMTAEAGTSVIACDLIEVAVSAHNQLQVPFVILPHILPDLPIYVVYADDPTAKNPIAKELEVLANRVIFDSESSPDLTAFARTVTEKHHREQIDVADLNWARIEGWRQLFANVFKAPDELDLLRQAVKIEIDFNAYTTAALCQTKTQSIYLQSWLANRLGWNLNGVVHKKNELIFSYKTKSQSLEIALKPKEMPGTLPGRPLAVAIETATENRYLFQRKADHPHHVIIEKSTPAACSLPTTFIFEQDVSGKSLVSEICHKGSSEHYLKMLAQLAQLQPKELCP